MAEELDILECWKIFLRHSKALSIFVAAVSSVALGVSLLLPKTYLAKAVLMPISGSNIGIPGQSSLSGERLSALSALTSGIGLDSAYSSTSKTILAILESRTLAERVVRSEGLMPILFKSKWDFEQNRWKNPNSKRTPTLEDAVHVLKKKHVTFLNDKKLATIEITGLFNEPEVAAKVVNRYVLELQEFINSNALTTAKRNRIFVQAQLGDSKSRLLDAGKALMEFFPGYRSSGSGNEIEVAIQALPENSIDVSAFPATPENKHSPNTPARKKVPPKVYYDYLSTQKEVLTNINGLLATQYELAKMQEAKEEVAFQVIDSAVPPVRKFGPKYMIILSIAGALALFAGVLYVFLIEHVRKNRFRD